MSDGTVIGGYSTCSRAIAAATAEGGGGVPAVRNKEPAVECTRCQLLRVTGATAMPSAGVLAGQQPQHALCKCGQGNDAAEETALLTNLFCGALLAFTHRGQLSRTRGSQHVRVGRNHRWPGVLQAVAICTRERTPTATWGPSCTLYRMEQSAAGGHLPDVLPGTGNKTTNVTTGWNASCPGDKAQYSCTRATCACEIAKTSWWRIMKDGAIDVHYLRSRCSTNLCACNQGLTKTSQMSCRPGSPRSTSRWTT